MQVKFPKTGRKKSGAVCIILLETSEPQLISYQLLNVSRAPNGDFFSLKI